MILLTQWTEGIDRLEFNHIFYLLLHKCCCGYSSVYVLMSVFRLLWK